MNRAGTPRLASILTAALLVGAGGCAAPRPAPTRAAGAAPARGGLAADVDPSHGAMDAHGVPARDPAARETPGDRLASAGPGLDDAVRLARIEAKLDQVLQTLRALQAARVDAPPERRYPALDLIGQTVPPFALHTVYGVPIGTDQLADYPATVLNFVAPNCGFCARQIPQIESVRRQFEPLGVRFVHVSETMGKAVPHDQALATYHALAAQLEVAFDDDNTVGKQFKVNGYPTLVVLDSEGTVRGVTVGAKADIAGTLRAQLDAILK